MAESLTLERYTPAALSAWNELVTTSTKPHFMFHRSYMDYHADRFTDASYLLKRGNSLLAVLPGNIKDGTYYSHQGLTFGSWLPGPDGLNTIDTLTAFELLITDLRANGIKQLVYKALPAMYHTRPAEEDTYALYRLGAKTLKVEPSTSIRLSVRGPVGSRRIRNQKKANKVGCTYQKSDDWQGYWSLLSARLQERHNLKPVHSLDEIIQLATAQPSNIELYTATSPAHGLMAGVVMYLTPHVAHAQYISASAEAFEHGALDGLFEHLIGQFSASHRWFDFGISSEQLGMSLNTGLITQKEEFGGSTHVHTTYTLDL